VAASGAGWLGWQTYVGLTEPAPVPAVMSVADPMTPAEGPRSTVVDGQTLGPATMEPNRLLIPSLAVYAPVEERGLVEGTYRGRRVTELSLPSDPSRLALDAEAGDPCGAAGTVVVSGHVASYGIHGALWSLAQLPSGSIAYLTCSNGQVTAWKHVKPEVTDKLQLPLDLKSTTGPHLLAVVTCAGSVGLDGHYESNLTQWFVPTTN